MDCNEIHQPGSPLHQKILANVTDMEFLLINQTQVIQKKVLIRSEMLVEDVRSSVVATGELIAMTKIR